MKVTNSICQAVVLLIIFLTLYTIISSHASIEYPKVREEVVKIQESLINLQGTGRSSVSMFEGRGIPLEDVTSRGVIHSGDVEDPHLKRFDVHLDGPTETDERARLFQNIARRFRLRFNDHLEYSRRDRNRIDGLKSCLHDAVAQIEALKAEQNRIIDGGRQQENENTLLVERVSGLSAEYVTACLERDMGIQRATKWKIAALSAIGVVALSLAVVGYLIFRVLSAM